ncbi:heme-binding protein 1 isoform 1-T1 [Anomaloglossus baeobatrachus]|uniref:heme-binding protein 1 isoform X1 n=1 Tax=Anomaloglossus baeobatrachus TaxID=238106 RepID=UPI003F4FC51C
MFGMIRNSLFGGVELNKGTLIKKQDKDGMTFEERTYDGGKFASVEVSEKPFDEATKECVLKLLKYVGGSNEKGAGMGMTSPVSIISYPTEEESLQPKVKVILRIPSQFQADPPLPTDESIYIESREGLTVYAMSCIFAGVPGGRSDYRWKSCGRQSAGRIPGDRQFGGYAKETDYVSCAEKLRCCLGPEASYHKDYYICCGYDPPMKPYGRLNEVWFVKNT